MVQFYAVTNNTYGSYNGTINTSNWKKIIAIAAGDGHTADLRSDGTVVAVGKNEQGH